MYTCLDVSELRVLTFLLAALTLTSDQKQAGHTGSTGRVVVDSPDVGTKLWLFCAFASTPRSQWPTAVIANPLLT